MARIGIGGPGRRDRAPGDDEEQEPRRRRRRPGRGARAGTGPAAAARRRRAAAAPPATPPSSERMPRMTVACATSRSSRVAIDYACLHRGLDGVRRGEAVDDLAAGDSRAMSTSSPATMSTAPASMSVSRRRPRARPTASASSPRASTGSTTASCAKRRGDVLQRAHLVARHDLDAPGAGRDLLHDRLREPQALDDVERRRRAGRGRPRCPGRDRAGLALGDVDELLRRDRLASSHAFWTRGRPSAVFVVVSATLCSAPVAGPASGRNRGGSARGDLGLDVDVRVDLIDDVGRDLRSG